MNEVLMAAFVGASILALFFYMENKAARRENSGLMRTIAFYEKTITSFEDEDEINDSDEDNAEQPRRLETMLGIILNNTEFLMVDTSKILAAVAAEKTKVDSLIALANGQTVTMKDLSAQLAAAIAANDPAALAQVQTDLDNAATALSTETANVTAAIDANTLPAPAPVPDVPAADPAAPAA